MKVIKNSTIIPLKGTMDSFTGGIYTSDGIFIEDSLLHRGTPGELQKPTERLSGTYIYGGCLFGHFGHFIWESLSRLYVIKQCNDYPIIFITPNSGKIIENATVFLKQINIRNEIKLIYTPTCVDNLIYSSPGSSIEPLFITDEQIKHLQHFSFEKSSNQKIWLSRSLWTTGLLTNESIIENELKNMGYTIINPENLSLREQAKYISTSDIVAGFDGSAFFSLLFAKNIPGKFIVFNRRKYIPQTLTYVLQKRNIKFEQHVFDIEHNDCDKNSHYPYQDKLIDILGNT